MALTISSKGWVVIPAELRKNTICTPARLSRDYGGVLTLVPAFNDPIHQTAGLLHQPEDSLTAALLSERAQEKVREDGR